MSSSVISTHRPRAAISSSNRPGRYMLAIVIIVFREVLEAGLIIGIVMAAAKGIPGRNIWVGVGVACGTLGASLAALFAGALAGAAAGMGQELFDAAILGVAVA